MKTRILVIENNEQSMYLLTSILEHEGFQVIQARDGYEGLEAAKQAQPALIVLNILLPGMSGYVVAQELRKDTRCVHVPILAVTTVPMLGNRARALEAGCTDYIGKPLDPTFLVNMVKIYLQPEPEEISPERVYH